MQALGTKQWIAHVADAIVERRVRAHVWRATLLLMALGSLWGCSKREAAQPSEPAVTQAPQAAPEAPSPADLRARVKPIFGTLPAAVESEDNPLTEAKINLGRMLYHDPRLSKSQTISCNSCHALDEFGIDVRGPEDQRQTSEGHGGQRGPRNSPTVYNAALHVAQFWDGREPNVEEQAKGPILNPIEMAMPDEAAVLRVLESIPGYQTAFKEAFPEAEQPISYDNLAKAIGAFERKLLTPAPFDAFLEGKDDALNAQQQRGLQLFVETGCVACHGGPALGGQMYMKMGVLKPYPSEDLGRYEVTKNESDKGVFKVPGLRNIAKTAPYMHDGSLADLTEVIQVMAEYQTPRGRLKDDEVEALRAFLDSLTGQLPTEYIKQPELPDSGAKTPRADAS